jgi:hypothetical protein
MKCAVEMGSGGMMYAPSSLKICTGIEGILRICLSRFKGCYVGITNGRDVGRAPWKWVQMACYIHNRFYKD